MLKACGAQRMDPTGTSTKTGTALPGAQCSLAASLGSQGHAAWPQRHHARNTHLHGLHPAARRPVLAHERVKLVIEEALTRDQLVEAQLQLPTQALQHRTAVGPRDADALQPTIVGVVRHSCHTA